MYNRSTARLLRWLKVPPEPQAPFGDPASLRVFRAGKNYFKLRLAGWALGQTAALAGVIFWAFLFVHIEERARIERVNRAAKAEAAIAAATASAPTDTSALSDGSRATAEAQPPAKKAPRPKRERVRGWAGFELALVELALRLPLWAFPVLWGVKVLGFLIYALQVPITYSVVRLDYELRWYVVTDRSLRIRSGVWSVQELTMSFANLQQVVVSQGPVQRVLKLADVRVQSAGGGGGGEGRGESGSHDDSLHTGLFHGVENAEEIRDLILSRLKRFRETGLGDPDEVRLGSAPRENAVPATVAPGPSQPTNSDAINAARELAAEARALREMLT